LPSPSSLSKKKLDNSESYIAKEFTRHIEYNQVSVAAGVAAEKPTRVKLKRQLVKALPPKKVAV
jgi:hypothetical protein